VAAYHRLPDEDLSSHIRPKGVDTYAPKASTEVKERNRARSPRPMPRFVQQEGDRLAQLLLNAVRPGEIKGGFMIAGRGVGEVIGGLTARQTLHFNPRSRRSTPLRRVTCHASLTRQTCVASMECSFAVATERDHIADTQQNNRTVSCRSPTVTPAYQHRGKQRKAKALLAILKPDDTILTPRLDRMFRSALDALDVLAKLKARKVSLHMLDVGGDVTGNGISKLVFTILSAVAEAERDRIRERISQVKHDQRDRGRYLGGKVPFGYRVTAGGALMEDAAEQEAIAAALRMRRGGAKMRAVQTALEAQGHRLALSALHRVLQEAGTDLSPATQS
jgi:putative DNA-invertase from lambdoid prophage Rac